MKKMFYVAAAVVAMCSASALTSCDKLFPGRVVVEGNQPEKIDTVKNAAGDADSLIITTYTDGAVDTLVVGESPAPETEAAPAAGDAETAEPAPAEADAAKDAKK